MTRWTLPLLLIASACRPELGPPKYPDAQTLNPTETNEDFLPGEVPFLTGDKRLFLSLYYEGNFSDHIVIDDVTRHYYVWESTYSQDVSDDRVEGLVSDRYVVGSVGWWGGGIAYDVPEDLSEWTVLHLCAASSASTIASFDVLVEWSGGGMPVAMADYGFVNDGEWHCMTVPTSAFVGADWSSVTTPLALTGVGASGDEIWFDDVYYRQGAP